jgi:hypothetical protein
MNYWSGPEQHISKEQRNFMYHAFTGDVEGLKKDFAEQFASAYVNVPQEDKTALYWASINLFPEAVTILLQHGADPFIRPPRGVSAGLTTRRALKEEVWVKKITPRLKDGVTAESLRAAQDKTVLAYDAVEAALLEAEYRRLEPYLNKARISPEKYHVENARLSRYGEHKIADGVHYWLEKKTGQVMPAMAEDSMTPLHIAVARCNDPLVRALVTRKADINVRNKLGMKPADMAEIIARFEKECITIVAYLESVESFQNPGRVKVHEVREHGSPSEERVRRKVMKEERQTSPGKPAKPVGF